MVGWDLAGEVVQAAADGTGPGVGARVVGLVISGAWAQRVAVATEYLAELPDGISLEQAATLPVAGLTALRSLERGGFIARQARADHRRQRGRRSLRDPARSSGWSACHRCGPPHRGPARSWAPTRCSSELEVDGPDFEVILDAIGGPVLGTCLQRVAPGGTVVSFASTLTDPVSYPTRELFARAPGARLYGLYLFAELQHTRSASADLRRLAELVAAGRLDPQIDITLLVGAGRRGDRGSAGPARGRQGRPDRQLAPVGAAV